MGHHHHHWARFAEPEQADRGRRQNGGRGRRGGSGPWGEFADWGRGPGGMGGGMGGRGRPGPPPWLAGIFGMGPTPERGRGPRVRRGDVRSAILSVLKTNATIGAGQQPMNGYQVIQQIDESTQGAWRPSPGSVYPTLQLLEDEGLIAAQDDHGRKTIGLSDAGRAYVADHAEELAAVWEPFQAEQQREERSGGMRDVKSEVGQVMSAVWQIVTSGSEAQQRSAIGVLVDTRRRLYGILADGDEVRGADDDSETEGTASADDTSHRS